MNPPIESVMEQSSMNMDKSLTDFEQEIKLLQDRIESMENSGELGSFGYKCVNSFDRWRIERDNLYKIITNPLATIVFYTRTIIEALTTGSLTEKEIRTSTLDICKDLGIKSTCRGTIAGLNLDVPAICNILASYGVLELDVSSTSTINVRNSLSNYRKRLMEQHKDQFDKMQARTFPSQPDDPYFNSFSTGGASDIEVVEGELNTLTSLADVIGKSYQGDDVFRYISMRWKEKLTKYFMDSQNAHFQALHNAALAAAAAKLASEALAESANAAIADGDVAGASADAVDMDNQLHDTVEVDDDEQHDVDADADGDIDIDALGEQTATSEPLWTSSGITSQPPEAANISTSSSSNNIYENGVSVSHPVESEGPVDGASKVLKRASNQRAWKLTVDISHLRNPEQLLKEWAEACYAEAAALETEEAVLRRLAGQCGIGIDMKPRRIGTSYLTQVSSEFDYSSRASLTLSGPRTLREGAQLTGEQLWEKARSNFVRRKMQAKGMPVKDPSGVNEMASIYGASFPIPHPAAIGEDGSGYLTHGGANKPKKVSTFNAAGGSHGHGETRAQHAMTVFQATRMRRYVPPIMLQNDGIYRDSVMQKGSIFASQFPVAPSSFPPTVIRPDLTLYTAEIPWSAIAKEFVTMDYEDLHHDSAVSSAYPSQPNSARGISHTPKYSGTPATGGPLDNQLSKHPLDKKLNRAESSNSLAVVEPSSTSPLVQLSSAPGDKSGRKVPLSISTSLLSATSAVAAPASNSKFSEVLAPQFTEIQPISKENYKSWRVQSKAVAATEGKDELNCSREIFQDDRDSSSDDAEEDISDEAIEIRHAETLRKMRDRWMQLQQLRQERKFLLSGGPHSLKSATGSGHKHGHGYGHKKKVNDTPRSADSTTSKGPGIVTVRKRGRGRPPKSHHQSYHNQYNHANGHTNGHENGAYPEQSNASGSADDYDGDSNAVDNDPSRHEEETDSAIDKVDDDEEDVQEVKRAHTTRSATINSPVSGVQTRVSRAVH